jgi:hypothetical protein
VTFSARAIRGLYRGSFRWSAALLIGVAVPQLAAAALIGAGARPGLAAGYLAGLLLVAWIAVQLLILQRYFFFQPVIAGIGAAEILLAWRWQRSGRIVTGTRDQRPDLAGSPG